MRDGRNIRASSSTTDRVSERRKGVQMSNDFLANLTRLPVRQGHLWGSMNPKSSYRRPVV